VDEIVGTHKSWVIEQAKGILHAELSGSRPRKPSACSAATPRTPTSGQEDLRRARPGTDSRRRTPASRSRAGIGPPANGSLDKTAATPLGPWPLFAVALGLVIFGLYSWCEARWHGVEPG